MIVNALTQVLTTVFDSLIASVGNLGVTESKERQNEVFRTTFFVNGMLYMIISCGFVCAVDPKTEDWMLKRPPGRGGQQVPMFVRIKSQRLARRETKHTLVFPTAHPKSSFQ